MPEPSATLALFVGALVLGVACLVLFIVAIRRMLGRHEDVVATMLQRYDHRLAEFAQTLSDALNQTLPARITAAISGTPLDNPAIEGPDHSNVVRVLELAREQTSADAAVAIVGTSSEPILATVGLSQAEATQVGGLSVPDYRGARAIQVSFNNDDAPNGGTPPIRSGLAVPLLDSTTEPGMLAVLTRTPDRRFSEIDITSLENVLSISRPALETSLEHREPDPVPERDPLTDLYDRPAFHALLELEITRARGRREQLALLILDVDRLTTINARIGHLAADDVLATIARVLNDVASARDLTCRVAGGRLDRKSVV